MDRTGSDEDWLESYMQGVRSVTDNPIWAMGYREELIDTGLYVRLSQIGLIDALLLPDCGADEQRALQQTLAPYGVDVVRFVHQSMADEELAHVCDGATIIYAQSYHGTTGNPFAQLQDLAGLCSRIERYTSALKVVGFGLRSPERVQAAIASGFDGAVVGSAFVIRCEHGAQDSLYRLIAEMKELAGPLVEKEE
jgi:tryptophan synthase alpha chain